MLGCRVAVMDVVLTAQLEMRHVSATRIGGRKAASSSAPMNVQGMESAWMGQVVTRRVSVFLHGLHPTAHHATHRVPAPNAKLTAPLTDSTERSATSRGDARITLSMKHCASVFLGSKGSTARTVALEIRHVVGTGRAIITSSVIAFRMQSMGIGMAQYATDAVTPTPTTSIATFHVRYLAGRCVTVMECAPMVIAIVHEMSIETTAKIGAIFSRHRT